MRNLMLPAVYVVQARYFQDGTAFGGPIWTVPADSAEDAIARVRANEPKNPAMAEYEMRAVLGSNPYALPPWPDPTQTGRER